MSTESRDGFLGRWGHRIREAPGTLLRHGILAYNGLVLRRRPNADPTLPQDLSEILERSRTPTDISHHLSTLFHEALDAAPKLIVELGTRGGDSTFVFERVARRTGAVLLSVDIADCSEVTAWPGWAFVQEDDVAFARRFPAWCAERGLAPQADVLFVDTTHAYEQTRAELEAWMPHLAPGGRALFHDSNMGGLYRRGDGTVGLAGDMGRGVIRALHGFLGESFDESRPFRGRLGGFDVQHDPLCSGLTILRKPRP
ncbi:MAG TPA: class I SAM-dependent methyltransferase [Longimicrobiales bacterium]|nr:class I SAM-dependent methyltransferase [Longimicrobiales bacterium]